MEQNKRPDIIRKYTGIDLSSLTSGSAALPSLTSALSSASATASGAASAVASIFPSFTGASASPYYAPSMYAPASASASAYKSTSASTSASSSSAFSFSSFFGGVSSLTGGGYALQVLFYLFLYGFVMFLILLIIHFSILPIFQFIPGGKGIIPVNTVNDYEIYWNTGIQPTPNKNAPDASILTDNLRNYTFLKLYTYSIDIYLTDLSKSTTRDKLIFYKACSQLDLSSQIPAGTSIQDYAASHNISMIGYLSDTNDLIITYYSGPSAIRYSSVPIRNVPLYTPFRISVVFDTNLFTVYLNGLQVSQTYVTSISLNGDDAPNQSFWANPSSCCYVQTLLLWNRPILFNELASVPVPLTATAKFGVTQTTTSSTCS